MLFCTLYVSFAFYIKFSDIDKFVLQSIFTVRHKMIYNIPIYKDK